MISKRKIDILFKISAYSALIFIILRWFFLINQYSVNLLFWDQWDFMTALFEHKGLWELFSWQHGPPRQGVGFFLTKTVADLSGWNTRTECFVIGSVVCLAALTALVLKWKMTGSISYLDITIPMLYLSPLQVGLFANTPNVSHGAMPLLLITLFCLCWLIKNIIFRYVLCAIINFMTIYTGFGVFIGCLTPFLFLSEAAFAVRKNERKRLFLSAFFFIASAISMLSFFINYTFNSAAKGFVFPYPAPLMYGKFILIAFSSYCGIRGSYPVLYAFAAPIFFCMIWLFLRSGIETVRNIVAEQQHEETASWQIISILTAFTLLFSLNLAIGRVCLGLQTASSSRYFPYLTPGFLAFYLFSVTRKEVPVKQIFCCMVCFFLMTFSVGTKEKNYYSALCRGKRKWKQAYLQTGDILRSNILSGFQVHPNPQSTDLQWKLDYLKKHHLNLYLDAQEH